MWTIKQLGNDIVIRNKVVGAAPELVDLGPKGMSLELAVFLHYKLLESQYKAEDDERLSGVQYALTGHKIFRDLVTRSQLAGMRGYRPKLIENYHMITPLGKDRAEKVGPLIEEINNELDNIVNVPDEWQDSDEMFLLAGIPVRVALMLQLLSKAIKEAKRAYEVEQANSKYQVVPDPQDEVLDLLTDDTKEPIPPKSLEDIARENEQKQIFARMRKAADQAQEAIRTQNAPTRSQPPQEAGLEDLVDGTLQSTLPQDFSAIVLPFEKLAIENKVWVPTATFGQKARNDLVVLVRYGLVDLKQYNEGNKGRPKHVIRPSRIGYTVLRDLEAMRLL